MFSRALLPSLVALSACTSGGGPNDDESGLCTSYALESVLPADGADGVYVAEGFDRIELVWTPSPALPFVDVVPSGGGDAVVGRTFAEDDVWVWTTTESLAPDTAYDVVVRTFTDCEPEIVSTFTTGPWGEADPDAMTDTVQLVEIEGDSFAEFTLGEYRLALWVRAAADDEVTLALLPMGFSEDEQEECLPTTTFDAAVDGPILASGPVTGPIGDASAPIWLVETEIRGLLRADGSGMDHVSLVGQLDITEFMSCDLLASIGEDCVPCSDGMGENCVDVDITGGSSERVQLTPVPRSQAQIDADEEC